MTEAVVKDGRVVVRNVTTGQIGSIDQADYANKFADDPDFRPVSAEELTRERQRAQAETFSGQAETFARTAAESAGDIARLGQYTPSGLLAAKAIEGATGYETIQRGRSLPAQALDLAGGDAAAYDERTRFLERVNPGTATAGSLTGQLLPAIATGGASMAAGQSLGGALAATGLRQGVAKAVGAGAAMAVEGAAYGAASAETSARQAGQTDGATAEQLLQGIGLGAVLGGGLGAGMSATGSLFRKLVSKADDAVTPAARAEADALAVRQGDEVATQAFSNTAKPATRDAVAEISSKITGVERQTLEEFGAHVQTPQAARGRSLWRNRDKVIDDAVVPFTKSADELTEAFDDVAEIVRNPKMRKEFVNALPAETQVTAKQVGVQQLRGALAKTEEILGAVRQDGYGKQTRDSLQTFVDGMKNRLSELGKDASAADVNEVANAIKQAAQKRYKLLSKKLNAAQRNGDINEAEVVATARNAFEAEVQEPLRRFLEDTTTWGVAGEGQAATNQRWVSLLSEKSPLKRLREELYRQGDNAYDETPTFFADTGKVKGFLSSAGTTSGQTRQELVRQAIGDIDDLATTIGKYHELTPAQAKQLERLQGASASMKRALGEIDETVSIANRIEEAAAKVRESAPVTGMLGRVGQAVTGLTTAGPMGGLMGAFGFLTNPVAGMAAADQLHAVAARLGMKTTGAASSWVREAAGLAKAGARKTVAATAGTARVAGKLAVPAAVAVFVGKSKSLEKAYEEKTQQLIRAKQDPDFLLDNLTRVSGGLASVSPSVAGALVAKTSAAIDYLAAAAPAGTISPTPLNPARKSVVPKLEMQRFARVWAAVEKPMTVLDDLRRGMATPEQLNALKAVHPETYEAIRMQVSNDLIDIAQKGGRIPLNVRQQLDLLLDLDGAGEPAFSPQIADRILRAQEAQKAQQQKQQPRKTPNLVASAALPQDKWPSAKG